MHDGICYLCFHGWQSKISIVNFDSDYIDKTIIRKWFSALFYYNILFCKLQNDILFIEIDHHNKVLEMQEIFILFFVFVVPVFTYFLKRNYHKVLRKNYNHRFQKKRKTSSASFSNKPKPVNLFPVTSPAMVIDITKRTKSSETNVENVRKHFCNPRSQSLLEISIYELWRKELWGYRFW